MIDIAWNIEKLECKPQDGGYDNVVVTAHWECIGTEGNYKARTYGSCNFPAPSSNFIPYDQLTKDQILAWCWGNGVSQATIEDNVITQVNALTNPPVVSIALPWA